MTLRPLFLTLCAFAFMAFAGCSHPDQSTVDPLHGKAVYDLQCAQCHEAKNLHLLKEPPKLDGLFRKQTLPSGAPATDAEVRNVILHGRGIMPPFEHAMDSDDVDSLIVYLHTR